MRKEALFLLGTQAKSLYTLFTLSTLSSDSFAAFRHSCFEESMPQQRQHHNGDRNQPRGMTGVGKTHSRKLSDDIPCTDYSLGNSFSVHLHLWFYCHLLCYSGHEDKL